MALTMRAIVCSLDGWVLRRSPESMTPVAPWRMAVDIISPLLVWAGAEGHGVKHLSGDDDGHTTLRALSHNLLLNDGDVFQRDSTPKSPRATITASAMLRMLSKFSNATGAQSWRARERAWTLPVPLAGARSSAVRTHGNVVGPVLKSVLQSGLVLGPMAGGRPVCPGRSRPCGC